MKQYLFITGILFSLFLVSCHKESKSEKETTIGDYEIPKTIPLKFTEPEPFEWEIITSDTLTSPVTYSLNVDALPTKPFELNSFKPLKSPMKEYDLEWDNMPINALKYDSVPFTIIKAPIKQPTITKMKPPGIKDGTNTNLLQLSINEGLITNDITSFVETKDGAIWIGTSLSSVMRYDGENIFTYDYSGVYKMTLDQQGKLWLMRPGPDAITVLDFKQDSAYTITTDESFGPLNVLCDHTGTLFFTSNSDGLYTMDAEMTRLKKLTIKGKRRAWNLLEDVNDNLWIGYRGSSGLAVLDKERKTLKTISKNTNYELGPFIADLKEDQSGDIWLSLPRFGTNASSSTVLQLAFKEEKIKVLDLENGFNIIGGQMVVDSKNNLWIMGQKEAFILNENNKTFKTITLNSALRGRLKLTIPLKRKDGSIWIATTDNGIVIANDFTLKTEYFNPSRGLINEEVWEIEESSRGELWLGTAGGINIINREEKTIKAISHELLHSTFPNPILIIKEIAKDQFLIDGGVGFAILNRQTNKITYYASSRTKRLKAWGITKFNASTFWMETPDGMYLYDIKSNILKKIVSENNPDLLKAQNQMRMVYSDKDILWIPSQDGLVKVDNKDLTVSYLREEQGLCANKGTVISFSEEGDLWLATENGIAIINLEENTLTNLKEESGLQPTVFFDLIEKDRLMYGASVNGLIPIEKAIAKTTSKGFYTFNEGLGFKCNDYLEGSAKFLNNGQFWAGVANPANEFRLLVMDGEPKPDTTASSVFITNMFVMDEDPGFRKKRNIDSLKINEASYATTYQIKWDSVSFPYAIPKGLELPYDQNSLSFSYTNGDIFNRDQLTYRFILDGADSDWTYAGTKTKTKNYYNLKPGQYSFKVAARGFNNEWSEPDLFTFNIAPPWWQTWWAYLLFGFLFIGAVWSFVSYRSRWLKKENRVLEERVTHRTSQLKHKIDELKATQSQLIQSEKMASLGELTAGIAHEIQNPLNFVNNFSEVNTELIDEMEEELKKGDYEEVLALSIDIRENQKKINHHGRRADAIVKGMLQHSRSSSNEKVPSNINAIADEYLRLSYHGLRAKDKSFNANLITDFDETIGKINIVPQDIGRVVLNLITNAFHACIERNKDEKTKANTDYKPTVWVSTKRTGNTVEISIRDNGFGVPDEVKDKIFQPFFTTKPSGKGTGLGLSLSYDIVQAHGGELGLQTKQGGGTTFTISLPEIY